MLEVWYDRSMFAIATWRGDAQRYWLTQVLEPARVRRDQWLQSALAQRATLEPAFFLGDRKHIPEAPNAVESVLRTEFLEVVPKPLAEACVRHGYCTAEPTLWYIMKQLVLPPDVNEVTMQKEILTPPKVPPAILDPVRSIIQGDSQEDARSVALLVTIHLNVHVQSSPEPRMPSGMTPPGNKKKSNGRSIHGRQKCVKIPRARKEKASGLSRRAAPTVQGKGHTEIDRTKTVSVPAFSR